MAPRKQNRFLELRNTNLADNPERGEGNLEDVPETQEDNNQEQAFVVQDSVNTSNTENPGLILTTVQLTGRNYMAWSRAMLRALRVKEVADFVLADMDVPVEKSAEYKKWMKTDCLVTSWLLNSITKEIAEGFQYVSTARELWLELKYRFGDSNGPQTFQIKREINLFTQGNLSVTAYYNQLKRFWDELAFLQPYPSCKCGAAKTCDCNAFQRMIDMNEEDKLIQFLMGLNEQYDPVKNQISLMDPLPSLSKAFSMLSQVEKQNEISGNQQVEVAHFAKKDERSVVFTKDKGKPSVIDKSELYCDYCHAYRHNRASCFKLIGYPDWWDERRRKEVSRRPIGGNAEKIKQNKAPTRHKANAVSNKASGDNVDDKNCIEDDNPGVNVMIKEVYKKLIQGKTQDMVDTPTDFSKTKEKLPHNSR